MWVLMYVFSYSVNPSVTNDRSEWRLVPTVVFQEFSNEKRCKAAKSKLEDSLKEAGAKLRTGLEDLKRAGAGDPGQIIIAYKWNALQNSRISGVRPFRWTASCCGFDQALGVLILEVDGAAVAES